MLPTEILLVMEYVPGGSLFDSLHRAGGVTWENWCGGRGGGRGAVKGWVWEGSGTPGVSADACSARQCCLLTPLLSRPTLRSGRQYALDVARGLAFLHSRRILHLDVKSAVGGRAGA